MEEAPKEVFLTPFNEHSFSGYWEEERRSDGDVEYIRKDIHDGLFANYVDRTESQYKTIKKLDEAQARIKELEEGLRFYTDVSNFDNVQEDPTDEPLCLVEDTNGNLADFGTTARKLLEKESEG